MMGIYLRVSTHKQKSDSQRAAIERWIAGNGYKRQAVRWFEDVESGQHLNRPAFDQLQEAIFHGEVKTVVVYKLDRIARNLRDGINLLASWCKQGVRVVSVTQQLDLTGPVGRLLAGVLFGLAEIELEHLRQRQAAGIAVAKEQGIYQGRIKGGTKAKPARARELRATGNTVAEIAASLSVSKRTVHRYLNATHSSLPSNKPHQGALPSSGGKATP